MEDLFTTVEFIKEYRIISEPTTIYQKTITGSGTTYEVLMNLYDRSTLGVYESFVLLLVNRANTITGWIKISQGGITGTVADVRLIMKHAIDNLACGIVLSHNHPSGSLKPSSIDLDLTRKIKEAAKLFDITVLDHLIVREQDNCYYSFADEGMM